MKIFVVVAAIAVVADVASRVIFDASLWEMVGAALVFKLLLGLF